jgi:hypothetical protein
MTNTNKDAELSAVDTSDAKIAPASPPESTKTAGQNSLPSPKPTSNKNALSHGVYATDFVLPIESQDDFEALLASFKAEWKPEGASEEQAVIELTHATWIGWRAARMAQLQFHRSPFGTNFAKTKLKSWEDLLDHAEMETPKILEETLTNLDKILSGFNTMLDRVSSLPVDTSSSRGKEKQMENALLGRAVSDALEVFKKVAPTIRSMAGLTVQHWTMFDKAYGPEFIEQQMRVMAAVGARIDKILRRLTSLKEYKRVAAEYAPKAVIGKPSVQPDPHSLTSQASGPSEISGATTSDGEGPDNAKVGVEPA